MTDPESEPHRHANAHLIGKIRVVPGDIVAQNVDAIVTTIPKTLRLSSKLNKDIMAAAGQSLDDYVLEHIYKPRPGDAFVVPGFALPARHVIFVVTPDWRTEFDRQDRDVLQCYRSATQAASAMGLRVVAFPALITGAPTFPIGRAARLAVQGIMDRIDPSFQEIRIVCYNAEAQRHYRERIERWRI